MALFNHPSRDIPAAQRPSGQAGKRRNYQYWYDSIIEWMILHPNGSIRDCAKALGRGENTLYMVTNSDVFKARYAERRREHASHISTRITEEASRLSLKSLEILNERLEANDAKISTPQIVDIATKTLTNLGYGAPAGPTINVQTAAPTVNVAISRDVLEDARAKMRQVQDLNASEQPSRPVLPKPSIPSLESLLGDSE